MTETAHDVIGDQDPEWLLHQGLIYIAERIGLRETASILTMIAATVQTAAERGSQAQLEFSGVDGYFTIRAPRVDSFLVSEN